MTSYFDQITEPLLIQSCLILFLISFTICIVIILSSDYGFSRRAEIDQEAVQSAHSGFVPGRWVGHILKLNGANTSPFVWFIPLAVVFDLNADDLTLLILSAAPVLWWP